MASDKQVEFRQSFSVITQNEIDQYEQRTCISLPEDYKAFLLTTNGGIPTPRQLDIPMTNDGVLVNYLYGIRENREFGDLEYMAQEYEDELPDGFIVIRNDPGGSEFLLATKGDLRGKIYFWDNDGLAVSDADSGNTFWLVDSITDLLSSLY